MAINYVHPSVSSTITDNSTVYITASGTTKLFAVFTSEKGIDNEIKMMTSVSEFEFNYGKPNMKLYGQTGYNIVNWLNSGGVVYCLRVLPEDAGYANAIVNIQTKVGEKEVLDVDGNKVSVPDVKLRPCVTYTSDFNKNKETKIDFNQLRKSSNTTVDGYENNMIFAVVPKGRGSGYNNLGFRMTLTTAYDSTYEFRLYNFEVTMTSDSGSTSTIQGPFLVSLDPDAMSNSGSSLFIVDVIDRYCDYFNIIFDEDNYLKVTSYINKDVHPNKIDIFNGVSRKIGDEYETHYNEITRREEDVHMSVIKYNDGEPVDGEYNIVDVNDIVESSIVEVDNAYRNGLLKRYEKSFERAKTALGKIRKIDKEKADPSLFTSIQLESIETTLEKGPSELDNLVAAEGGLNASYAQLRTDVGNLEQEVTETNYGYANSSASKLADNVETLLDQLYELYDYANIGTSSDPGYAEISSSILTELKAIESKISTISITSLNCNRYVSIISDLLVEYTELTQSESISDETKVEFINKFTSVADEALYVLNNISDAEVTFADDKLAEVEGKLALLESEYDIITSEYSLKSDVDDSIKDSWDIIKPILEDNILTFVINLALLEKKASVYFNIETSLANLKTDITNFVNTIMSNISNIGYDFAKNSVDSMKLRLNQQRQENYVTLLQNYDSYVALQNGTNGSIEGLSYKDPKVEKLIINGYTGDIDVSLKDKDQWPIDMVLDANYSAPVKNAIASLCTEYRDDFMGILDTELQASPADVIDYRKNSLNVNNFRLAIFTQHFVITDAEYTGNNIEVTPTYFLASKIPANDNSSGIHWNFVGPRRGTIAGYKSISFLPNPTWRENLYNAQINYVQQDQTSTRFGSQLTSQSTISALSNISCVRTLLRIQRDVEDLMKTYQFEFNDNVTITNAQTALNSYLNQWISNRACDSISGTVYASDYDRQQKLLRVKIELVFNSIIERIAIDLIVNA